MNKWKSTKTSLIRKIMINSKARAGNQQQLKKKCLKFHCQMMMEQTKKNLIMLMVKRMIHLTKMKLNKMIKILITRIRNSIWPKVMILLPTDQFKFLIEMTLMMMKSSLMKITNSLILDKMLKMILQIKLKMLLWPMQITFMMIVKEVNLPMNQLNHMILRKYHPSNKMQMILISIRT